MKDKILTLIIGILIGAIITTICFYFINKSNESSNVMPYFDGKMMSGQNGGTPPDMPSGNSERPEKPSGTMNNGEEPPAKPTGEE